MQVINSTRIVFVDCDDTLVMWEWRKFDPEGVNLVDIGTPGSAGFNKVAVLPHTRHIEMLKQFKARGHTIVVWSQGGDEWAKNVVETLKLEKYVDFVMSKPSWYIDDLPAGAFMGKNIYLHPTDPTKDQKSWVLEDMDE